MSDDAGGVDEQRAITQEALPVTAAEAEQNLAATELSRGKDHQQSIHAKVYSPYRDYYDGQALSVSAENTTGPFDILPKHHNFITLLSPCDLVVRTTENDERKIRISGGVMHVKADRVIVFLDI